MKTEYLRAGQASGLIGVDEEKRIINGYVLAQAGDFKTGRGSFDGDALATIVRLVNATPGGVVVNYGHHAEVGSPEALDAFLGRASEAWVDGDKVRGNLHFNPVAFMAHNGGVSRGERLMQRAKTDPGSFASSLVIAVEKVNRRGATQLWKPLAIQSSDVVYIGDAVHGGILSAEPEAESIEDLRARNRNRKRKSA